MNDVAKLSNLRLLYRNRKIPTEKSQKVKSVPLGLLSVCILDVSIWCVGNNHLLTLMKRVPITLENETELRVTRQKCIKNVGLRRLRA
uniref:Uncharacterized protein n=1 Tax=Candidatus Kentrum sp. UNK TaxID=2126344 RepID=A0A451ABU7_9GAMM|nr:MAG: hypothetical protein BECKUNK1418G_GA0071005_103414 [Candidatus Kentron sp. UNK]VFK70841.1 MAG: hypothetical protein BECKUNK1418H_GA0071006_104015 [Candidatus Kentron sp. UNK]